MTSSLQQAFSKATWQADQFADYGPESPYCSPRRYSSPSSSSALPSSYPPASPLSHSSSDPSSNYYPKTPDYRSALVSSFSPSLSLVIIMVFIYCFHYFNLFVVFY